jgi:signal transduction histidine kinase
MNAEARDAQAVAEALTNVAKHAQATTAQVRVAQTGDNVISARDSAVWRTALRRSPAGSS